MVFNHRHHNALVEPEVAGGNPCTPAGIGERRVETARQATFGQHLRIALQHGARCAQGYLGRKRQRRQRRPSGQGAVIRPVRYATRGIAEQTSPLAAYARHVVACAVTGGQPPAVSVVAGEFVWIAFCVFALDQCRAPAVLEIVATLLAHEAVLDAAKIDPRVRELVHEQRPRIQEIVAVQILPLIGRGPGVVAMAAAIERVGRRPQCEHVQHDGLAVAIPAVLQEAAFRLPAHPDRFGLVLRPTPVNAQVQKVDQSTQLDFVGHIGREIHGSRQRAGDQQRGVDHRQLRAPHARAAVAIEKVVVKTLIAGRRGTAALIAVAEETQRSETEPDCIGTRHPASFHRHRIGRQCEPDHGDADG